MYGVGLNSFPFVTGMFFFGQNYIKRKQTILKEKAFR
jgi:hypothetical protein